MCRVCLFGFVQSGDAADVRYTLVEEFGRKTGAETAEDVYCTDERLIGRPKIDNLLDIVGINLLFYLFSHRIPTQQLCVSFL